MYENWTMNQMNQLNWMNPMVQVACRDVNKSETLTWNTCHKLWSPIRDKHVPKISAWGWITMHFAEAKVKAQNSYYWGGFDHHYHQNWWLRYTNLIWAWIKQIMFNHKSRCKYNNTYYNRNVIISWDMMKIIMIILLFDANSQ